MLTRLIVAVPLKAAGETADMFALIGRVALAALAALAALVVAAVGVLTGTIDPKKMVDRIPRPGHVDKTAAYLDLVEGDFARLQPLSGQFFNGCNPKPAVAGTCYAAAVPMLGALRSFQTDLEGASVPDSFAAAHASLKSGVAKGLQGLADVLQAVPFPPQGALAPRQGVAAGVRCAHAACVRAASA